MLNVTIVDDQLQDYKSLKEYLLRFAKEEQIQLNISWYSDALLFYDEYKGKNSDIVFMDVEMPHIDGIELAKKLRQIDEKVVIIFITNMAQYAIKGYEVNALDYVLKPIHYGRLSALMRKTLNHIEKNQDAEIWLKTAMGNEKFYGSDLIYIEVRGHLVVYHTLKGDIEAWSSLKEVSEKLPDNFFRCSNKIIVNCKYIKLSGKDFIELTNGLRVTVPRSRQKEFFSQLNQYMGIE